MRQHDPKILYKTNVNVLCTSVCKNTRLYIFNKDAGCSVSDYKKKLLILFIYIYATWMHHKQKIVYNIETESDSFCSSLFTVSCAVPGYTYNSLLGCYRIQNEPGLPNADAKQECAKDGGRLLLVNSAAEATELASVLSKNFSFHWLVCF